MKVSYAWLQTFFKEPLPTPEEVVELFTFHTFEVEDVERRQDDVVFDIKVLPDRAPYALSHQGIARELGSLIKQDFISHSDGIILCSEKGGKPKNEEKFVWIDSEIKNVKVNVEDKETCDRARFVRVMDITSKESPPWLSKRLFSVGARSISFVVDLTNFVMLETGQPLHAFDADKVKGDIVIRKAKEGEKITLLDGKEVTLDSTICVIADEIGPLDIAGIKGGKRAEVTLFTKHIILTGCHFNAEIIRKTSDKVKIKNDASKRFENNVSILKAEEAIKYFLFLLKKEDEKVNIGETFDSNPIKEEEKTLSVSIKFIEKLLGLKIGQEKIIEILNKGGLFSELNGDEILIRIPDERKDINIKEDVVEEVGRIYGYVKISGILPKINDGYKINKNIFYQNKIKKFLLEKGFSEVYNYALTSVGEVEIANPLASDKSYLRPDLATGIEEKLKFNLHSSDLLGEDKIRLFEIGHVFKAGQEMVNLSLGIAYKKAKKGERVNDEIKEIRDELLSLLLLPIQTLCTVDDSGGILTFEGKSVGEINKIEGILEMNLDLIFSKLPLPIEDFMLPLSEVKKYKPLSIYPFISRDIAVFVPGAGEGEVIKNIIESNAGELLQRIDLFDVFTKKKDGEETWTSYAYRLVFQSYEKTLSDDEVNNIMLKITEALKKEEGFEIR